MREMLGVTGAIVEPAFPTAWALVTDGRFSGATHGFMIAHVAPEASTAAHRRRPGRRPHHGGCRQGVIDIDIPAAELARRLAAWKPRAPRYKTGVFAKYCALSPRPPKAPSPAPVGQACSLRRVSKPALLLSHNQHAVPVRIEPIPRFHRVPIRRQRQFRPRERAHQQQQTGPWQMEV